MNKYKNFAGQHLSLILFLIVFLIFAFHPDYVMSVKNIMNILTQNAYVITVAMGTAVLMISGSIDISVGAQISLIGILCARLLTEKNVPSIIVIITAVILGVVFNLFHMFLSVWWNLPTLIVSIGTMTLYQGMVDLIGTSRAVLIYNQTFRYIGTGYLGPVSIQFILACITFLTAVLMLNRTYPGRYIYAVGSNPTAARLSGINVTRVKAAASIFYGITVAAGSLLHISRLGSAQTGMGDETIVTVLTAGLLGGISVKGGSGKISSVFLMMLSLSWLSYIILMTSYGVHYRNLIGGTLLLLAFGCDFYRSRKKRQIVDADGH